MHEGWRRLCRWLMGFFRKRSRAKSSGWHRTRPDRAIQQARKPVWVPKRVEWFEAWGGLLNGFYLSG